MLVTAAIWTQPAGTAVTVAPLSAIDATSTSPAAVPAGLAIASDATAVELVVVAALWKTMPPPAAGVGFTPSQMRALTTTTASTEAVSEARPAVLRVCAVKLRGFWCVLMLSFLPYISRRAHAKDARAQSARHSLTYEHNVSHRLG